MIGALPLVPFLVPAAAGHAFFVSSLATAATLFLVGSARSIVIHKHPLAAGAEMLAVGGVAALIAFGIGFYMKTLIGQL